MHLYIFTALILSNINHDLEYIVQVHKYFYQIITYLYNVYTVFIYLFIQVIRYVKLFLKW